MSTDLVTAAPSRQELEALPLSERVALENAVGAAHVLIRSLNDDEITRLHKAGASQRAVAAAMGVHYTTARRRLAALGFAAPVPSASVTQPLPQNGDTDDDPADDSEVVDGEVVEDDKPEKQSCPTCGRPLPAHMQSPPVPRRNGK